MLKQLYYFLSPKFQNLFLEYKVKFDARYGQTRNDSKLPHKDLLQFVESNRNQYEGLIDKVMNHKENLWAIKKLKDEKDSARPGWNNMYLPGLDVIAIYLMLAEFKPKKYIEIGSGNSTKVAHLAKKDNNLNTEIISIDPRPRVEIDKLADTVVRKGIEEIDLKLIHELEENDILFVDGAHRVLPNSDSMIFFMDILHKLKKGVIVHVHDIYIPYEYPNFMLDRFYSEQYSLSGFMLADPEKYQTLFPNYFISEDPALKERLAPIWNHPNLENVERHGGSFWMRICK